MPLSEAAGKIMADLREGQIALLENLRFHPGEEKNDEGFARWWAQSRAEHRRVGSIRLRRELLARGIAPDLAAAAAGAAFEAAPELDRAMHAASKRLPALLRKGREHAPARLGNYLLRRGYPPEVTTRVVKALLAEDLGDAPAASAEDGIV